VTSASPGARRVHGPRLAGEVLVVFFAVLLYLWPFRLYGFDVTDEGVQLVQIERVTRGERPYRDFETSYTPGYFAAHAALWKLTGVDLAATRTAGLLLHAVVVAAGFALVRVWAGGATALATTLLQVAFLFPVSLRSGAPFNVPYPAWLASACALGAQSLIGLLAGACGARRRDAPVDTAAVSGAPPRPRRAGAVARAVGAVAAGAAAGLAFSVKPNAGLLTLGGVALGMAVAWEARARATRAIALAVRAAAVAGALVLVHGGLEATVVVALVLPVVLAAARAGAADGSPGSDPWRERGYRAGLLPSLHETKSPRRQSDPVPEGGAVRDLALVAVGFALVVLPWLVPLAIELGLGTVLTTILHLEGSAVRAYLVPFAAPAPSTVALAAGLCAAAWLAADTRRPHAWVRAAPWALCAGLLGAAIALVLGGSPGAAPARLAAENACLWLGPVLLVLGLATCPRSPEAARERSLLAFAAVYQLQLYPRPDLLHVAMGAPPVLLAISVAWSRRAGEWRRAFARATGEGAAAVAGRRARNAMLAVVALLATGRALPTLVERLREPVVELDLGPRALVVVSARHASQFDWLVGAVRAVRAHSVPGDALFAFPDLPGLGFLTERAMPFYYLYFVPGRPDRAAEAKLVAQLDEVRPAVAVVAPPSVPAFAGASEYFGGIDRYLREHYAPAERAGECTILVRRPDAARDAGR
jgi:hypothetical protein